ncbi:MAG: hypothetical protein ACMG5Z_03665 [Luteimonas sp.]
MGDVPRGAVTMCIGTGMGAAGCSSRSDATESLTSGLDKRTAITA